MRDPIGPDAGRTAACDTPARSAIRFATDQFPERDRVEIWREVFGRTIVKLDIDPLSPDEFRAEAVLRALPGLGVLSMSCSPMRYYGVPSMNVDDDIVMSISLAGGGRAWARDRAVDLGEGDAVLMGGGEGGTVDVPSPARYISLRAPLATMSRLVDNPASAYCSRVPAQSSALRLLTCYVGILDDETLSTPDLRHNAVTHIHDLMALAIGATRDAAEVAKRRGVQAARLSAVKEDIAKRLDQPDLSVATLAALHRCSPRYLQGLFETEGTTFTEYVLAQRLARAHAMLSDRKFAHEKVGNIAYEAGFTTLTYFNRVFRQRYGAAPSDLRAGLGRLDA
jgi:AraC-like DNA-binding protein